MKVLKFLSMMAIALCVVACSDDDAEEAYVVEATPAEEIENTYTGYSYTSFAYGDILVESGESVAVTANSDGTVDVVLTSTTWGTWTVESATVTETTDGYTITGTGTADVSMSSSLAELAETAETAETRASYDCTLTATISADLSEAVFVFYASFMGGTTITVGTAAAADYMYVVGSYTGWTSATFVYSSSAIVTEDETVEVEYDTDAGAYTITYTSDTWGTWTIDDVTVEATDDGYSFTGSGVAEMSSHSGGTSSYDCTLDEAYISSDGETASFTLTAASVMGGTTIVFTLGDAPDYLSLAGTYTGWTSTLFAYITTPMIAQDETVEVAYDTDTEAYTISYTSDTWGTWTFDDVTAEATDDGYSFTGSGVAAMASHSGGTTNYDCTLDEGTISSDGETVTFTMTAASVMGGTTIVFTLGDAPGALVIQGSHSGYTTVGCAYFTYYSGYYYDDQTVTITADDDNETVSISYTHDTWGEATFSGVTVTTNDDGSYTLSGDGVIAMANHSGSTTSYDATVSGTVTSDGVVSELLIYASSVMGGTTISFYEADFPAAFAVGGSYTGDLATSVSGIDCGTVEDLALTVTPTDEVNGVVSMTIGAFDMNIAAMGMSMSIGEIAIEGVSVTTSDNETFTVSASSITVEGVSYTSSGTTTTINVIATIDGTILSDGSANITFSLTFGSMPMAVTCVYTVEASTED